MYNGLMNKPPIPFLIVFTKQVIFKDRTGTITETFEINDIIPATADTGSHYVTTHGGIYHDEARKVEGEELVHYAHINGGNYKYRFRQYAKDTIPPWATDLKLEV